MVYSAIKEYIFIKKKKMKTQLIFNSQHKIVVATISGKQIDSAQFRAFALEELVLLQENKSHKLIVDISDMGVMSISDQKWLQSEWNERAIKSGLRYMAFVVPKDIFGKVAMQNATSADKLKQEVIINYFDNA